MKLINSLRATPIKLFLGLSFFLVDACTTAPEQAKEKAPPNRLIRESSPYLLQHAYNPVDWYPWGAEARKKAREEDRLLLISIGYSACHWCHVMEKETFSDTAIARIMNRHFISVKVDREERPDVDAVYMRACQLTNETGCGWPLNAIALPNGKPVWVGTYLTRDDWKTLLEYFREAWPAEKMQMETFADRLTEAMQPEPPLLQPVVKGWPVQPVEKAASRLLLNWDMNHGGRKGRPKFPLPGQLDFLMHYHWLSGHTGALDGLLISLHHMARGGLHDQLGGGFARYATDTRWRFPHFEKMLYDNAQLLSLYAQAWQYTGEERFRQVTLGIWNWLYREMRAPQGGYFSSLDADSPDGEGKYYSWTLDEVRALLSEEAPLVEAHYGLSQNGNWKEGQNLLYQVSALSQIADSLNLPIDSARARLDRAHGILLRSRRKRSPPARDEKIITAWNALLISGLADTYQALGDPSLREEALRLGRFLIRHQKRTDGGLHRIHKEGKASISGFLDDYAYLARAFLDLYEISFDPLWLAEARQLADYATVQFEAPGQSLLCYRSRKEPALITRLVETEDQVLPSSNAAMAEVLMRLGVIYGEASYTLRATNMLHEMRGTMENANEPGFFNRWWSLYLHRAYPQLEVVVLGPEADAVRQNLQASYLPPVHWMGGQSEGELPLLQNKRVEGQTTIYLCQNRVCQLPVTDPAKAKEQIRALFPALR